MNFSKRRGSEEPEINLIPLIDVLLVVIIFLMLTTTYTRFSSLEITLPSAEAETPDVKKTNDIEVDITTDGQISVAGETLKTPEPRFISEAMQRAAKGREDPIIIINSDAKTAYQSVVDVMQAAQMAGYPRISFTAQSIPGSADH
ncbi:MAG: biopolymer transporter ExbD [Zoogloeaceae bacterium]|jgi:biopolymer transport protein ExbD|nr:biopolymer transporter ExbD [Zoogloeaceae bacterium]